MKPNWLIESLRSKKYKRQKIIKNALRAGARPMSFEEIQTLQVQGVLDLETFYDNISYIFPVILELVQSGLSISKIEKRLGFADRSLENCLFTYKRLRDEVQKVRKLKSDVIAR